MTLLAMALAVSGNAFAASGPPRGGANVAPGEGGSRVLVARAQKRKHRGPSAGGAKTKAEDADAAADGDDSGAQGAAAEHQEAPPKGKPPRESEDGEADRDASGESAGEGSKKAARPKIVMEREAEPAEAAEHPGSPSALELGVGGMALFRQLVWTSDARAAGLGPYSLTPGPEAGVWLEFYPAAFAMGGFAANIGLIARYDYGFGVTSYTPGGGDVGTKYQDFLAGLKVRLPLGMFTPNLSLAYGEQGFKLNAEGTPQDLPAMDYSFVRIGAGTRVQLTPAVALDVNAAFLAVTNPGTAPGQVASAAYFPKTQAYAVDVGTSVAIRVASSVGVRAGLDLRQYGLAFHPDSNSRAVAGAVDRYIVGFAGLEVVLDGQGAGATHGAAAGEDGEEGGGEAPPKKAKRRHSGDDDEPAKDPDPSDDET